MIKKLTWCSSNSLLSCFFSSVLTNWKWDFCLQWMKKKKKRRSFHTHPLQTACGHDRPWTHHWLQLRLCGMMQMMTNSFIPHHGCAANRCNTRRGASWHLAEGLNCLIESFSGEPVIRLLSGRSGSPFSSLAGAFRSLTCRSWRSPLCLRCVYVFVCVNVCLCVRW